MTDFTEFIFKLISSILFSLIFYYFNLKINKEPSQYVDIEAFDDEEIFCYAASIYKKNWLKSYYGKLLVTDKRIVFKSPKKIFQKEFLLEIKMSAIKFRKEEEKSLIFETFLGKKYHFEI